MASGIHSESTFALNLDMVFLSGYFFGLFSHGYIGIVLLVLASLVFCTFAFKRPLRDNNIIVGLFASWLILFFDLIRRLCVSPYLIGSEVSLYVFASYGWQILCGHLFQLEILLIQYICLFPLKKKKIFSKMVAVPVVLVVYIELIRFYFRLLAEGPM